MIGYVNIATGEIDRILSPEAAADFPMNEETHTLLDPVPEGIIAGTHGWDAATQTAVEVELPTGGVLATAKWNRRAALADRRWRAQQSFAYDGVAGVAYGADTAGNLVATMQMLAAAGEGATTPWKLARGAHRVWTLAQLNAFAFALGAYIAACFAHEAELDALIEAAEDEEAVAAIDLDAGWPS